jgi:hypothetical protein
MLGEKTPMKETSSKIQAIIGSSWRSKQDFNTDGYQRLGAKQASPAMWRAAGIRIRKSRVKASG